jgi:hypothetical protein
LSIRWEVTNIGISKEKAAVMKSFLQLGAVVGALLSFSVARADESMAPVAMPGSAGCCGQGACGQGGCKGSCWDRLCDWLTYRPLTRPCLCDCCCHCCECCPPLYTFFLCQGHGMPPPCLKCGGHFDGYGFPNAAPAQSGAATEAPRQSTYNSFTGYTDRAFQLMTHRSSE